MSVAKRGDLEAYVRRPDARTRAVLIHGPDRTSVRELADRVLGAATQRPEDPFDVAKIGPAEIEPEHLDAELTALSLMGGRRVVHVRSGGDLGVRERTLAEALTEHAEAARREALLLIEAGPLDRRSALRKAAEASPVALSLALYEEDAGDLGRLARDVLERERVRCSPATLALLAERLPRDRGVARQVMEGLVLYAGPGSGAAIGETEVAGVLGDTGAAGVETALYAFSGQQREVAAALARARLLGDAGPLIVRQLSLHLAKLSRAQAAIGLGSAPAAAVKSVGVFWKHERQVLAQLSLWRPEALDKVRGDLLAADVACKSAGAPDELIAHQAALQIAATAARLARTG